MNQPNLEVIIYLAENNPGCIAFLKELEQFTGMYFMKYATILHDNKLTGSRAYMLWNDACDRDIEKTTDLLRDIFSGRLSMNTVNKHLAEVRCRPFTYSDYHPMKLPTPMEKHLEMVEDQYFKREEGTGDG